MDEQEYQQCLDDPIEFFRSLDEYYSNETFRHIGTFIIKHFLIEDTFTNHLINHYIQTIVSLRQ